MASPTLPSNIERFQVLKVLGKGAQGQVFLAKDPELERQVAIKTLNTKVGGNDSQVLLNEAKIVGQLNHPNIVSVFDIGRQQNGIFMVMEYVKGKPLDDILKAGKLPLDKATAIMEGILAGMAAAHQKGILHRDIKPSNVLVGDDGRAMIMDFGIATLTHNNAETNNGWGTPGYLAPEILDNKPSTARSDVFSLGTLFYELITGRKAFEGKTPEQILFQVAHEPLLPPSKTMEGGDVRFDQLILRATDKKPENRFADADEFLTALQNITGAGHGDEKGRGGSGAEDFLLRKIKRKPDFPGISRVIQEVNHLASDTDRRSASELANVILKDYGITQKLLRLSNSPYYGQFGGNIHTITRSIIILGFNQVRAASLSLILFENMKEAKDKGALYSTVLESLLGAIMARTVTAGRPNIDPEEAFICSLLHSLGKMLVIYYFPEEYRDIQILQAQKKITEDAATNEILGTTFIKLAKAVAREWNFPKDIIKTMEPLPEGELEPAKTPWEEVHQITSMCTEMANAMTQSHGKNLQEKMSRLQLRYKKALKLKEESFDALLEESHQHLDSYLKVVKLPKEAKDFLKVLETNLSGGDTPAALMDAIIDDEEMPAAEPDGHCEPLSPEQQVSQLMQSVNEITQSLLDDFDLNGLLQSIMETTYRTMGLKRVLLCILGRERNTLLPRYGFGDNVENIVNRMKITLHPKEDVFGLAINAMQDVVITDSYDAKISKYIPDWYRRSFNGESFLLFPLVVRKKPIGLFYLEASEAAQFDANVLKALKSLRNQAVLAIAQAQSR